MREIRALCGIVRELEGHWESNPGSGMAKEMKTIHGAFRKLLPHDHWQTAPFAYLLFASGA